jgi:hypothetical protein
MVWLWVYAVVTTILLGGTAFFLVRFVKRTLQFDQVFELLAKDLHYQAEYCNKLAQTPIFLDTTEVRDLVRYTRIIRDRMKEFCSQMEELTGKSYVYVSNPQPKVLGPRPVVVD